MKKLFAILLLAITMTIVPSCKKEKVEPSNTSQGCSSVQCSAIAASTGERCKHITTNCNGRCYQHQ